MSNYFEDAENDESNAKLSEQSLPMEFLNALTVFDEHRQLLSRISDGEYFRLHLRDEIEHGDIAELHSAGLVESKDTPDGESITDWKLTRRTLFLSNKLPENFEVDAVEASALIAAGDMFAQVPDSNHSWKARELESLTLTDRQVETMRAAGHLQRIPTPDGQPTEWSATRRYDELADIVRGFVYA